MRARMALLVALSRRRYKSIMASVYSGISMAHAVNMATRMVIDRGKHARQYSATTS